MMLILVLPQGSQAQQLVQTVPDTESWSMAPTTLPEPIFVFDGNDENQVRIFSSEDGKLVKCIVLNMPSSKWQEIHDANPFQLAPIEFLLAGGGTIPAANLVMIDSTKGVFIIPGNGMLVLKEGQFYVGNRLVERIQLARVNLSHNIPE